jgi:hypothetical protein
LTADGEFSVAGISPSTNFADTVFIYKETDYSDSTAVTRYTRKDYTVLGTSLYPTDTGHSVSNWFVRYGWTNAITLKTDVRLPTGNVKLSIIGEYDAYSLFVSNRVTHVYDEIIRSGHDEFQTSISQWLSQYVDSNNLSVAYLTQACAGIGEIPFSFDSSYSSSAVSCDAKQKFTSYNFLVEAITSENRPSVYNPSGIAEGDIATYQVVLEPGNYPDSGIHWSTTSSNIEFVNGNTGRIVNVKGITATDTPFTLDIDIDGIDFPMGQHPYLTGKVLTLQALNVNVYVICDDDGTNPVVPNSQVDSWLTVASNVFRQAAMPICQISNVHYINKTSWKNANTTNILMDIVSYTNVANVLSIYCVDSLLNGDAMGAVVRGTNLASVAINGIVVSSAADEYTLSHEIGHECALCDILNEVDSLPSNIQFGDDLTRQEWVTDDWTGGSGTGFHFGELTQSSMMERLLMFGKENIKKGDISLGNIYGFDSHGNRIHVKTGISGMNRTPLN